MKESIASTYIYNILIIFMVIVFAFVMGTIIYYKSFKINKSILAIIEKYEGYNNLAKEEINTDLKSIGYALKSDGTCPQKNGVSAVEPVSTDYKYCIYYFPNDTNNGSDKYYSYGVTTYITFDFPLFNLFLKIPIYTKSNRIFRFNT
ncbi:MAG TPA: hypothetical protein PLV83_02095 [Bacilli bacterium]|nr:hypothetical protein [Bacilli bacterium]